MKKPHDISTADFLPERQTIPALRKAAQHCKGCHLYKNAIQTVFGEGTKILITFHPSAILRSINESDRHKMKRIFLNDLRKAATILK